MNLNNPKIKILTLGESAVGKSSIIVRYVNNKFNPSHTTTLGVDLTQKKLQLNGQQVLLQIWDTAGQERFKTITPVYYKCVQGVVIVFSLTDRDSFENIQYWMSNLKEHSDIDKIKIILVGNKSDLKSERKVTQEEAEIVAKEMKCTYYESSAKKDENISIIFEDIAEQIMSTYYTDEEQRKMREEQDNKINLNNNKENGGKSNNKKCC